MVPTIDLFTRLPYNNGLYLALSGCKAIGMEAV